MQCRLAMLESEREAILEQRYRVFVEHFQFFEPSDSTRRMESDKYDEHSLFFGVWENNELIGSCRLVLPNHAVGLPTLNNMAVDDRIGSDLLKTAEISRIIAATGSQSVRRSIQILKVMQQEIYRVSRNYCIEQWIGSVEPAFLRLLQFAKLNYAPMGPLQTYIEVDRYPVVLKLDDYQTVLKEAA